MGISGKSVSDIREKTPKHSFIFIAIRFKMAQKKSSTILIFQVIKRGQKTSKIQQCLGKRKALSNTFTISNDEIRRFPEKLQVPSKRAAAYN